MSKTYSFRDVQITPVRRELRRGGELVDLPPQVFDFLVYLLERHDRAVSRDELVAAVWGRTEVSDTLLGQTVLRARRELGDDARTQRILRTIPRFGYRWMAPVDVAEADAPMPAAGTESVAAITADAPAGGASARARPRRRWWLAGAGAIVALLLIGGFAVRRSAVDPPQAAVQGDLATAVLPAQLEAGPEWAWLRLAVMDVVAGRLRSSGIPSVPSEDVISLLRAPSADVRTAVRRATTASLLLTPAVRRDGDAWTVTLESDGGDGQPRISTARSADALAAAREATDGLLRQFGLYAQNGSESIAQSAFVRRLDAAILADDATAARALIAEASEDLRDSVEVRLRLAKIDFRSGHFEAARGRLQGLLDEAPASRDPVTRASVLNGLGVVAIRQGRLPEAGAHFDQAVQMLASGSDPQQLGQAYLGRGNVAAEQGRPDAAMEDYARARSAFRAAADPLALARVAANEGFLDLGRDRPAAALPPLLKAAESFRDWGALNEAVYASIGAIRAHLALLDNRAAIQVADAAAELDRRIDNPDTRASFLLARARALAAVGRLREAREALDAVRAANRDDTNATALADALLARLELEQRQSAAAGELAGRAVEALAAPTYAVARAEAWLTQLRAALQEPTEARAAAVLSAFEAWAETGATDRPRFHARLARAEYAARFAAPDEWHRRFEAARTSAEQGGVPAEIAAVARSYATALIAHAELDAAAVEAGRVSRWSDDDFACALLEAQLHAALGQAAERDSSLARARTLAGERPMPVPLIPRSPPSGFASNRN